MEKRYTRKLRELKKNPTLLNIDISKILGCTPSQYGLLESGKRLFSIEQIIVLANYYKVSINYILGNDNKNKITENHVFSCNNFLERMISLRVEHDYKHDYIATEY